jgi:dTDP-4-dehydrorhamnose reductase
MKLLLLGADGQVGFALQTALVAVGDLVPATRKGVLPGGIGCVTADLSDLVALRSLIERERPDWVVNAAAHTAVDKAEGEPAAAMRANAEALATIGDSARRIGARVLHYSTDYVFPGTAGRPWREDDATAPLGVYGRSKLAGEQALRDSGAAHLILRTAWVYGPRGNNFLRTMLRLAGERDRLTVVADQSGTPTTAALIAQVSALLIAMLGSATGDDVRFGTYHLTASGHTSWHGFATEIVALAHSAGLIERAPIVDAITSDQYPTAAKRPAWSVLDTQKIQSTFNVHLPDWRHCLQSTISAISDERMRWRDFHQVG